MSNMPRFKDWEVNKLNEEEFIAAAKELEPGFQITRLRIQRGLPQTQLAELVGARQPSIARLENGTSQPSLTFLIKVARALNAKVEVRLVSDL